MNKILLALFLLVAIGAGAQRSYFIYIQTENQQRFFIKQEDKIIESTASGYLILSNLKDSIYQFDIGISGKENPIQHFTIPVNRKDRGYLLKNFGDKWGLYDLQTSQVISPATVNQSGVQYASAPMTDAFSVLLARASDDPKLLYMPVIPETMVKKETVKPKEPETKSSTTSVSEEKQKHDEIKKITDIIPPDEKEKVVEEPLTIPANETEIKKDSVKAVINTTEDAKKSARSDAATEKLKEPEIVIEKVEEKPVPGYVRSKVLRKSESSTTEGFGLVFIDEHEEGADTIRIMIPHTKVILSDAKKQEDARFLDIDSAPDTIVNTPIIVAVKEPVPSKNCKDFVNDNEYARLRKKMASAGKDDNMTGEAKKVFRNKCFTTEQIRELSEMFTTNGGKYYFFDAAYTAVSDPENFSSLESQLKDEYFIKRFKALLKN